MQAFQNSDVLFQTAYNDEDEGFGAAPRAVMRVVVDQTGF